jgi:hypothetical protein
MSPTFGNKPANRTPRRRTRHRGAEHDTEAPTTRHEVDGTEVEEEKGEDIMRRQKIERVKIVYDLSSLTSHYIAYTLL